MEIVIALIDSQIKISQKRLDIAHYPTEVEPAVRQKIEQCNKAIAVLRAGQKASKTVGALPKSSGERINFFLMNVMRYLEEEDVSVLVQALLERLPNERKSRDREVADLYADIRIKAANLEWLNKTTTLETEGGLGYQHKVTSCCKEGPITNENYCSNCGLKIEKK